MPSHPSPCADTFIQKTKKLYVDTRTQRNIARLNQDIAEVHQIMTRNINDVLSQGERLDSACARVCFGREGGGASRNRAWDQGLPIGSRSSSA